MYPCFLAADTIKLTTILYCRLAVLAQRAEISLVEKKKKEAVTPSPTPTSKPKKGQRIKALSPKVERDERLEVGAHHRTYVLQTHLYCNKCRSDVMPSLSLLISYHVVVYLPGRNSRYTWEIHMWPPF